MDDTEHNQHDALRTQNRQLLEALEGALTHAHLEYPSVAYLKANLVFRLHSTEDIIASAIASAKGEQGHVS